MKFFKLTILFVVIIALFYAFNRDNVTALINSYTIKSKPNVILISLDTLRADRLGAYGYSRDTSPTIDALANEGAIFYNHVSVSSWTLPTHVSIFSGLYPTTHGVTRDGMKIGKDTDLMAEVLARSGYRTFAFTGGHYVGKRYGFDRGFESYLNSDGMTIDSKRGFYSSIKLTMQKVKELSKEERFFIFLHTFDIHCPYNPPEPYYSLFKSDGAATIEADKCGVTFYNKRGVSKEEALYISDRYDGSIRWADDNLKLLLDFLKSEDLYDNTIIIITSDHGEEFLEHGQIGHQESLHRELLMTPLIITGPGVKRSKIASPVSQIDILPTLLDLIKVTIPADVQGLSLVPYVHGSVKEDLTRPHFSELDRKILLRSKITLNEHIIHDLDIDKAKLYDLVNDPTEQRDLSSDKPERADDLIVELGDFFSNLARKEAEAARPKSQKQIEALKSLGYL